LPTAIRIKGGPTGVECVTVDLYRDESLGISEIEVVRVRTDDDLVLSNRDRQARFDDRGEYSILELASAGVVPRHSLSKDLSQPLGAAPRRDPGQATGDPVERTEIQNAAAETVVNEPSKFGHVHAPGKIRHRSRERKRGYPAEVAQIRVFERSTSVDAHAVDAGSASEDHGQLDLIARYAVVSPESRRCGV